MLQSDDLELTLYASTPQNGQTLKQFVGRLLANCLNVFDHFVGLVLKGLIIFLFHFYFRLRKEISNTR